MTTLRPRADLETGRRVELDRSIEERVLLLLPGGRSSVLTQEVLRRAGLDGVVCETMHDLIAQIDAGAGCVVVSTLGLVRDDVSLLSDRLADQPPWSDLPVLLLVDAAEQNALSELRVPANTVALERPTRPQTLISAIRTALRARSRQYQVRDLQAELEQRVEARTIQVRALAKRLASAEQQERRRISRVLHDGLQQLLFGVKMRMSIARDDAASEDGDAALVRGLDQALVWLGEAIDLTRRLSVELSPPILKNEGLVEALGWLGAQLRTVHGLQTDVVADPATVVPDEDIRALVFQIIRELLFNVVKHAGTDRARVEAGMNGSDLVVRVVDEGRGFDPADLGNETGLGLIHVRERLELFDGDLTLESEPGAGATVTVRVPT